MRLTGDIMLKFRPLEMGDKETFIRYSHCFGYHNIEASFANKYIWCEAMKTRIAFDDEVMYTLLNCGGQEFMLTPFFRDCSTSFLKPLAKCEEYMLENNGGSFLIKGVNNEIMARIEKDCPGRYRFIEDRANFEYVYLTEDLANLSGKKFHAKRNHINKLVSNHVFEYRRYKSEDFSACIDLQEKWIQNSENTEEGYEELRVIERALKNLDALDLVCGVLIIDGKLEAFSIGECFDYDMVIIHIEKANTDIDGTFALINREFVRNEWGKVKYIDREEDMGLEGLRKAKLSYNPVFFLEKYDCVRA
jgi:uncharacterized protein